MSNGPDGPEERTAEQRELSEDAEARLMLAELLADWGRDDTATWEDER